MKKHLHIGIGAIIILAILTGYWFLFSPTAKAKKACINRVEYHPPTDSEWVSGDYYTFENHGYLNTRKFKTHEEAIKVCVESIKEYY